MLSLHKNQQFRFPKSTARSILTNFLYMLFLFVHSTANRDVCLLTLALFLSALFTHSQFTAQCTRVQNLSPVCITTLLVNVGYQLGLPVSGFFNSSQKIALRTFQCLICQSCFQIYYSRVPNKRACTRYLILTKLPTCTLLFESALLIE